MHETLNGSHYNFVKNLKSKIVYSHQLLLTIALKI